MSRIRSNSRRAAGHVLAGVVDDVVRSDRGHQVHAARVALAGHLGAHGLRELDREGPDTTGRPGHEHMLTWLERTLVAQGLQRGEPGHGHGGRLFEREVGRFGREVLGPRGHELGERPSALSEDLVPGPELGDVLADRLDHAGEVDTCHRLLRSPQPLTRADHIRVAAQHVPVVRVHGGRLDADEDAVVAQGRLVDLAEFEDVRGSVSVVDDGLHRCRASVLVRWSYAVRLHRTL